MKKKNYTVNFKNENFNVDCKFNFTYKMNLFTETFDENFDKILYEMNRNYNDVVDVVDAKKKIIDVYTINLKKDAMDFFEIFIEKIKTTRVNGRLDETATNDDDDDVENPFDFIKNLNDFSSTFEMYYGLSDIFFYAHVLKENRLLPYEYIDVLEKYYNTGDLSVLKNNKSFSRWSINVYNYTIIKSGGGGGDTDDEDFGIVNVENVYYNLDEKNLKLEILKIWKSIRLNMLMYVFVVKQRVMSVNNLINFENKLLQCVYM